MATAACGCSTTRTTTNAFEQILGEGLYRYPVELLTYCLMPNHWHLVVRPRTDPALGRMMGWVGVTHVRRHQEHYHRRVQGTGTKVDTRTSLRRRITTSSCSVVTSRPTRCGRVGAPSRAVAVVRIMGGGSPRYRARLEYVAADSSPELDQLVERRAVPEELKAVRVCVARGRPLGTDRWVQATAKRLGLGFTLRGPGRPRKLPSNE